MKVDIINDNGAIVHSLPIKYKVNQYVFVVKKRMRKIIITRARILSVSARLDSPHENIRYQVGRFPAFGNYSKDIFADKEDAYEYAEQLSRRKNIKLKYR